MAGLLVLLRPAKNVQTSAEKLEHSGPAEKERVASVPQREQFGKYAKATCAKMKRNSCLSRAPDHWMGESQGVPEQRLSKREGIRAGVWRGKGGLHSDRKQVPRR